jgi:hypothetical protein
VESDETIQWLQLEYLSANMDLNSTPFIPYLKSLPGRKKAGGD